MCASVSPLSTDSKYIMAYNHVGLTVDVTTQLLGRIRYGPEQKYNLPER